MTREDNYILVTKAANILGCESDKVHELCDEGLVRRVMRENTAWVRREDIAEVHRLNLAGELKPGEMVKRLLFLEQKVKRLEDALNMLFEVNNLAASRFSKMGDRELISVYESVIEYSNEEVPLKYLLSFAEAFLKITEVEIDRLNDLLNIDNSWLPFFQLCLQLTRQITTDPNLSSSVNLQRARDLLYGGRKNLQTIAMLFIERKAQLGPSRKLLNKLAAHDIDAFDALAHQLKKTCPRSKLRLC